MEREALDAHCRIFVRFGKFPTLSGVSLVLAVALSLACAARVDAFASARISPLGPLFEPVVATPATTLLDKEIAVYTEKGISRARALEAVEAQSSIGRAQLVEKIIHALGRRYAGVWLEPAVARLAVGATTRASRHVIARVAADTGLSGMIEVRPVRSTLAQLIHTQRRLDRRLTGLFARAEVTTGLEPQRNAVTITLGSAVTQHERAAIEREARSSRVAVNVVLARSPRLSLMPLAKTACKKGPAGKFVEGVAFCDPSITAGTAIASGGDTCTAGPAAIPMAKKNRTVLLTAGHCIDKEAAGGTGLGANWSSKNKAEVEGVVGPAESYSFGVPIGKKGATYCGGLCNGGDFADILIQPAAKGAFQTGKPNNPVFAVTAEWKKMNEKGEETSYPIVGEQLPAANAADCHEGESSGESCGQVKKLNVNITGVLKGKTVVVEGLVEDAGATLVVKAGDSGGPFIAINGMQEATAEGILSAAAFECVPVAKKVGAQFFKTEEECRSSSFAGGEGEWERKATENVLFMPLKQPAVGAAEGPLEKLKLELLTNKNEPRKPRLQNNKGEPLAKKFYTSTGGATTFETVAGNAIKCSAETGKGEASTTNTGTASVTLTGCEGFSAKCMTAGAAVGEVRLSASYTIVFISEAEELGYAVQFPESTVECGVSTCTKTTAETVKLKGTAIGLATPVNKEVTPPEVITLAFSQTKGVQSPAQYLNEEGGKTKATIELSGSGTKTFGFEQAGISLTKKLLFEEVAELEW